MDNSEFKEEFISETSEYLEILNHTLLELEKTSVNAQAVQEMFRIVHSLKSIAAGMGYHQISDLSHQMENVLAQFRAAPVPVPAQVVDLLFESLDVLQALLRDVAGHPGESQDILPLVQKLSLAVQ